MVGQRPGPSLALVQKCGWSELAQSCCRVHLEQQGTGQTPRGLLSPPTLPWPSRHSLCPSKAHRVSSAHQPQ